MDYAQAEEKLHELAPQIAKALGAELHYIRGGYAEVTLDSGERVCLRSQASAKGGRIEAFGRYPQAEDGTHFTSPGKSASRISAAMRRGAEAIARDIERRLLPDFLEEYAEAAVRADAYDARRRAEREALKRLAELTDAEYQDDVSHRGRPRISSGYRYNGFGLTGEATAHENGVQVSLTLRGLPMDVAEEICAILGGGDR